MAPILTAPKPPHLGRISAAVNAAPPLPTGERAGVRGNPPKGERASRKPLFGC